MDPEAAQLGPFGGGGVELEAFDKAFAAGGVGGAGHGHVESLNAAYADEGDTEENYL